MGIAMIVEDVARWKIENWGGEMTYKLGLAILSGAAFAFAVAQALTILVEAAP